MKGNIRKVIRFLGILALVLAGTVVAIPAGAHSGDVLNCGLGTPQINGVMSPGEWDTAGHIDFTVNTPYGGTTDGTVFAMNDGDNLYLALRFDYVADGNSASFRFDNDNSGGAVAVGDDVILFNPNPAIGFSDNYMTTTGIPLDTAGGGTNDGAAAFSNDGTLTVYEFSHPLDSADNSHDFSLQPGDTVGFNLDIRLIAGAYPEGYGDTLFPTDNVIYPDLFGDIVTAVPVDNGGEPNDQAWFGQAHKDAIESEGPGVIGDFFSNNHEGKKGLMPPWEPGDGGVRGWMRGQIP
jgi:hypothetical protein